MQEAVLQGFITTFLLLFGVFSILFVIDVSIHIFRHLSKI